MKKIENLKTKLIFIPLLFIFYLIMKLLNTTCIIKSIFGISCPGCGMTRAIISAIKFDFLNAFKFHPMFWSVPILLLYFIYDGSLIGNKMLNYTVLGLIALGYFANWIIGFIM